MIERDIHIWQPFENLPELVSIKSFADDINGIEISLYDAKENIHEATKEFIINFPAVYAYRNIDESYHLDSAILNVGLKSPLLIVKDGDFLEEFNRLSIGIYRDMAVNYTIITPNDILEIIAHKNCDIKFKIWPGPRS